MEPLLAKSLPARTLEEHIKDCLLVYKGLLRAFPRMAVISGEPDFWKLLEIAIICHDLGKSHRHFQLLLKGQPNLWEKQRHELFSLPFVEALSIEDVAKQLIYLAVMGHHRAFDVDGTPKRPEKILVNALKFYDTSDFFDDEGEDRSFEANFKKNVHVRAALQIASGFGLSIQEGIVPKSPKAILNTFLKNKDNSLRLLLFFGALKHCDHMGSALLERVLMLEGTDCRKLYAGDFIPYAHQQYSAKTLGNAILTAPTGSGKTESAFMWLEHQLAKGDNSGNRQGRIFYVLPFTASINAMFERLGKKIDGEQWNTTDGKTGMLHGKLSAYLDALLEDQQFSPQQHRESIKILREQFHRISTPLKIVTPFQLLKHIFGLKGFEQGLFELSGGYLIFDEIHAYSPDVFAQIIVLIEFLTKNLDVRIFIMTATLPGFMRTKLADAAGSPTSIRAEEQIFEAFTRHRVVISEGSIINHIDMIKADIASTRTRKVLVVCNTVQQAQDVFHNLKDMVEKEEAVLLHGGFNARDRNAHEQKLMATNSKVRLLVGTQAIEVSLDIDFDIIYTEPAPLDALLQRFGRVNRKREKGICDCVVFAGKNDKDKLVYSPATVDKTLLALEKIVKTNEGIVDESILQELIDEVYDEWLPADLTEYESVHKYLKGSLTDLVPFIESPNKEEDFYRRFDGVPVLPQSLEGEYLNFLAARQFIKADNLMVKIRKGVLGWWTKEGFIHSGIYTFEIGDSKKKQINYLITNKLYDMELGLQKKEHEVWTVEDQFS